MKPVTIPLNYSDYQIIENSGLSLEQLPLRSVRLSDEHLAWLALIQAKCSLPGLRLTRVGAARIAVHEYCKQLTQGQRYQSFSELVRDAVAWRAQFT